MLVIRGLSDQDFGNYECQINSNPVKIRVVSLARPVTSPPPPPTHHTKQAAKPASLDIPDHSGSITNIIGAPDIYFRQGSLVNITCVVNSLKRPEHIFWYHDGQVISYYSARGGISIVRQEGLVENESRSTIILRDGDQSDQGTYTCRPLTGDFKSATTRLFLLSAGVSTENNCQIFPVLLSSLLTLLSILLSTLLSREILEAPLKRLSVRYFADVALKNHQEVCKAIYIRLADKTHLSSMLFNVARPLRLG